MCERLADLYIPSSIKIKNVADEQAAQRIQIRGLAWARASYGYWRLHLPLEREGWANNHSPVYRLYSREGLILGMKKPKRHAWCQRRAERTVALVSTRSGSSPSGR